MAFERNDGRCPAEAAGKRVRVVLRGGCGSGIRKNYRPLESWAADGRAGCRWTLTGDPFDIIAWELAG